MSGNAVEAIHKHLESTIQGATIAGGYAIPADFRLVTRRLRMWDETGGLYPAAIIQIESVTPEALEFCYGFEARVKFRVILYFKATSPDEASQSGSLLSGGRRARLYAGHQSGWAR